MGTGNRTGWMTISVAVLISALLLTLLTGLFYNAWQYEIDRITVQEGSWHCRIAGADADAQALIRGYGNVERTEMQENGAVAVWFRDRNRIPEDLQNLQELLPETDIAPHSTLLSMYMVRVKGDTAPRLIFPLLLGISLLASFSLILIVRHAFLVSMCGQMRTLGLLAATPGQLRRMLLRQAATDSLVPMCIGTAAGVWISAILIEGSNHVLSEETDRLKAVWHFSPLLFAATVLLILLTIGLSAAMPAWKLSRIPPLEAIRSSAELSLKRRPRESRLLSRLFGAEGGTCGSGAAGAASESAYGVPLNDALLPCLHPDAHILYALLAEYGADLLRAEPGQVGHTDDGEEHRPGGRVRVRLAEGNQGAARSAECGSLSEGVGSVQSFGGGPQRRGARQRRPSPGSGRRRDVAGECDAAHPGG